MKKLILCLLLAVCFTAASAFSACAEEESSVDYFPFRLDPKTVLETPDNAYRYNSGREEDDEAFWNEEFMLNTFAEYEEAGVDIGYKERFFKGNGLLLIMRKAYASEELEFSDILIHEKDVYPVLERNLIESDSFAEEEEVHFIFYVEIPNDSGYVLKEIVNRFK